MPNFRIFTESGADVRFIRDYILEVFSVELSEQNDFDTLGSYSGYIEGVSLKKSIIQNHDNNKQTILILDANGNITERRRDVTEYVQQHGINPHLFLFPNNSGNGNLETLLTEIAIDRIPIDCFLAYEHCVSSYQISLEKERIYSYLNTLLPDNCKTKKNDLRKESTRNYRNPAHWNLHHAYLQPLNDFLAPFFQQ